MTGKLLGSCCCGYKQERMRRWSKVIAIGMGRREVRLNKEKRGKIVRIRSYF